MCPDRQLQSGSQEFLTVKDITPQPTLTICLKNMDREYKLALATFTLTDVDDTNLHFRDDDG